MDLSLRELDADPTESILVGSDSHCVRTYGAVFVHFQENKVEAEGEFLLVFEGENLRT